MPNILYISHCSKAHTRRLNRFFTFVDEQKLNKDDDVHSTIDAFNQQLGTTPKEKSKVCISFYL